MAIRTTLARWAGAVWRVLDRLRRVLHLALLLLLVAFFIAILLPETVVVPDSAALLIAPSGTLVDQLSGNPLDRALAELRGDGPQETLLKDLIDAIRHAKADERIRALHLQLDGLGVSGLSKLQELGAEIDSFKESGKLVVASSSSFARDQYYLAAKADEIYMHPMGMVLIEGYSKFLPYYKSALDKLYVDYEVWTAGEYKSFPEPYTRDDMSPEDREESRVYLESLWRAYQADVTAGRDLDGGSLQVFADQYAELLAAADGDAAVMARDYGLIDELVSRQALGDRLADIVGASQNLPHAYEAIDYEHYLQAVRPLLDVSDGRSKVAVVTLVGTIYDGSESPGAIGSESAVQTIEAVTADDDVRALVLRVDSPGGSAFAADVILDALQAFQEDGRPLVVSMGSVAASGGYWISMSADEIWASPTTITGSIGVGAVLPTVPRALDKLGVHVDGLGTTDLAGQFSWLRGLGDDARALYGLTVENLYSHFIGEVAAFRERTPEQIDAVARGRVWSGEDAYDAGLVDRLGHLEEAIEAAADRARLEPGGYTIDYVEPELGIAETLALEFARGTAALSGLLNADLPWLRHVEALVESAARPLEFVAGWNDPRGLYSYCFCDVH